MSPQEQSSVENQGFSPSAEILSDEEIRSRAAAFAQRIFEQQMESYEAQRAQAIAMMRAQEEYARQKAAYEEACREYYERQGQVAVRVDAETGEEIYSGLQNQFAETAESAPDATVPAAAFPAEEPDSAYFDETAQSPENSVGEEMLSDEDYAAPADYEQGYEPASGDAYSSDAEAYPQGEEEEIPPEIPEEASEVPAAAPEPQPAVPAPAGDAFPWFAVAVSIFCVSVLAAVGYILFSGDPRFEHQRKHFLAALHISENSVSELPAKTQRKVEIPDFGASKPKPAPASDPEEKSLAEENSETAGVPAPLEAESDEAASEEPSDGISAEESAVADEETSAEAEEPPAEEDEELFEDEEDWLDD